MIRQPGSPCQPVHRRWKSSKHSSSAHRHTSNPGVAQKPRGLSREGVACVSHRDDHKVVLGGLVFLGQLALPVHDGRGPPIGAISGEKALPPGAGLVLDGCQGGGVVSLVRQESSLPVEDGGCDIGKVWVPSPCLSTLNPGVGRGCTSRLYIGCTGGRRRRGRLSAQAHRNRIHRNC